MRAIVLLAAAAGLAAAQQIQLNLDQLAARASDKIELTLNGGTLQFAAKFLDNKDADEAKVKKMIAGIDGIYIRSFEFAKEGGWLPADLEGIRRQLKSPEWTRVVGYQSATEGQADVYTRTDGNKKVTGVVILVAEPREFSVVNLTGNIDMDTLADLSGNFGVPKIEKKK